MNLFLDAKNRIENWKGLLPFPSLSKFIVSGLSPLYGELADKDSLIKEFGLKEENKDTLILIKTLSFFLELEDTLLSVADYLLSKTSLKEFEKAVKLEEVRQLALLPLMKGNEVITNTLGINKETPVLARHTPKGR